MDFQLTKPTPSIAEQTNKRHLFVDGGRGPFGLWSGPDLDRPTEQFELKLGENIREANSYGEKTHTDSG
jgi:hypothetical protein